MLSDENFGKLIFPVNGLAEAADILCLTLVGPTFHNLMVLSNQGYWMSRDIKN